MDFYLNWSLFYLYFGAFMDDLLNNIFCIFCQEARSCGLRSECQVSLFIVSKESNRLCDDWLVFSNECELFVIIIVISPQFLFGFCLVCGLDLFNFLFKKCYFVLRLCYNFKRHFRCIFILFFQWTFENYFRILFLTYSLQLGNDRIHFNFCRFYRRLNKLRFLYGRLLCRRLTHWFVLLFWNMFHSILISRYLLLHIEWPLLLLKLDSCTDRSLLLLLAGLLSR